MRCAVLVSLAPLACALVARVAPAAGIGRSSARVDGALVDRCRRTVEPVGRRPTATRAAPDDDDEAPAISDEDWRAFRAKLVTGGITTTEEEDGGGETKTEAPEKRAGLDEANVVLAKSQSKLAGEIVEEGAWAHEVGSPEVGGLLLRLPLETQLAVARDSHWGRALRDFAGQERTRAAMEDARRRGVPASEAPAPEAVDLGEAALYRTAGRFLQLQLQRIAQKGQVDGSGRLAIDPRALTDADKALLDMHQKYLGSWQEVVLVVRNDENGALGVVLNRPAATEGAPQLSQALCAALEGDGADRVGVEAFNGAFGKTIAAYVGKPAARDGGDQPAMVIHGVSDLEGASELAPGLGIYRGGAAAAAESVAGGAAEPLDFRFFIGRYEWGPGELARDVRDGVYRPAACSRGVALKQCLGLPKPLWHEVMDMLGGSSADVSSAEMARRNAGK